MPHDLYPPGLAVRLARRAGQKWRPSNGEEGALFMDAWCGTCANDLGTDKDGGLGCAISTATFWHSLDDPDYPREWCLSATGQPQCTAYMPKPPA